MISGSRQVYHGLLPARCPRHVFFGAFPKSHPDGSEIHSIMHSSRYPLLLSSALTHGQLVQAAKLSIYVGDDTFRLLWPSCTT
jgi:hypothetical protein